MKIIRVCCFALAVFLITTASARADLYMNVSGKVIDDATKAGIPNVAITAFRPTDKNTPFLNATTDQNGVFIFQGLTAGDYQLNIEPNPGYVRTVTVVTVPNGKNLNNVVISLKKSGFISGTVLRADGTPLNKALLIAVSTEGYKSTVTTASDGTYVMKDLIPSTYKVHAMAANVEQEFIMNINVTEGQTTANVNFVLGALNQGIQGIITDVSGNPIQEVVVFASSNGSQAMGVTDATGHYSIQGLNAGTTY